MLLLVKCTSHCLFAFPLLPFLYYSLISSLSSLFLSTHYVFYLSLYFLQPHPFFFPHLISLPFYFFPIKRGDPSSDDRWKVIPCPLVIPFPLTYLISLFPITLSIYSSFSPPTISLSLVLLFVLSFSHSLSFYSVSLFLPPPSSPPPSILPHYLSLWFSSSFCSLSPPYPLSFRLPFFQFSQMTKHFRG